MKASAASLVFIRCTDRKRVNQAQAGEMTLSSPQINVMLKAIHVVNPVGIMMREI
jgi:hypothetical protein